MARRSPLLAVILGSYLMIVLDVSIVINALPRIQHALDFSATGLSWVQSAYTLTFGGLLRLGARAGDLLGRRRMFIFGIALFALSCSPQAPRNRRRGSSSRGAPRESGRRSRPRRRSRC